MKPYLAILVALLVADMGEFLPVPPPPPPPVEEPEEEGKPEKPRWPPVCREAVSCDA